MPLREHLITPSRSGSARPRTAIMIGEAWRVGDTYDRAFNRLQTRDRLAPQLRAGIVQERAVGVAELLGRGLYRPCGEGAATRRRRRPSARAATNVSWPSALQIERAAHPDRSVMGREPGSCGPPPGIA